MLCLEHHSLSKAGVKLAIESDEKTGPTDYVLEELRKRSRT